MSEENFQPLYKKCFLWRTDITINDQRIQLGDETELPILKSHVLNVEIPFNSFVSMIDSVLQRNGLPGVNKYWYGKAPLFLVEISGRDSEKVYSLKDKLQKEVAAGLQRKIESLVQESASHIASPGPGPGPFHVEVNVHSEWAVFNADAVFNACLIKENEFEGICKCSAVVK